MYKLSLILVFIGLISSIDGMCQENNGYRITGALRNLKDGTRLWLLKNGKYGVDTVKTTISTNEKFTFDGKSIIEGDAFFIVVDSSSRRYQKKIKGAILIIMENKNIHVSGDIYNLSSEKIHVKGSQSHQDYLNFQSGMDHLVDSVKLIERAISNVNLSSDSSNFLNRKIEYYLTKINQYKESWVSSFPNSLFTPWLVLNSLTHKFQDTSFLPHQYSKLSKRARESKYGLDMKELIRINRQTALGTKAPNLPLLTELSLEKQLSGYLDSGKLTLIDFWASWCKPCRAKFGSLKKIYDSYKSRGFNIIGISTDNDISAWKKCLKQEQLPWVNLLDHMNLAGATYGVNYLPTTFLIDKSGKIIAVNINNSDLEKRIQELIN